MKHYAPDRASLIAARRRFSPGAGDASRYRSHGGEVDPDDLWAVRARAVVRTKLRHFGRDLQWPGKQVLVIQPGGGLLAEGLFRRGCKVTGIDSRREMVRVARERAASFGYRIDYRTGTPDSPHEFPEGAFDAVLCDHLFDRRSGSTALLESCSRLLRPGGQIMFTCLNATWAARLAVAAAPELLAPGLPLDAGPVRPISPRRLLARLRAAGFDPDRPAGLSLRGFSLDGRPVHRITARLPVIWLGRAHHA